MAGGGGRGGRGGRGRPSHTSWDCCVAFGETSEEITDVPQQNAAHVVARGKEAPIWREGEGIQVVIMGLALCHDPGAAIREVGHVP